MLIPGFPRISRYNVRFKQYVTIKYFFPHNYLGINLVFSTILIPCNPNGTYDYKCLTGSKGLRQHLWCFLGVSFIFVP
jgi:hypothetical protein